MKVLRQSKKLRAALTVLRESKKTIGFVPTMGYLHEGHLSLVRKARKDHDIVVVSIFVNPLQFGPKEDLKKYPRAFSRDSRLLKKEGVDFLFFPELGDFYPSDFQTQVCVKKLSQPLCGLTRPTHFAGVATVVLKLLNLVMPDTIYLGQKDYQQCRVIEQMVEDLSFPVRVKRMPILREKDGLAMSSRNIYLSKKEREEALFLSRALKEAVKNIQRVRRDVALVKREARVILKKASSGQLDYFEIVDAQTLAPVVKLKTRQEILVAVAVYFGKTRLIDNLLLKG